MNQENYNRSLYLILYTIVTFGVGIVFGAMFNDGLLLGMIIKYFADTRFNKSLEKQSSFASISYPKYLEGREIFTLVLFFLVCLPLIDLVRNTLFPRFAISIVLFVMILFLPSIVTYNAMDENMPILEYLSYVFLKRKSSKYKIDPNKAKEFVDKINQLKIDDSQLVPSKIWSTNEMFYANESSKYSSDEYGNLYYGKAMLNLPYNEVLNEAYRTIRNSYDGDKHAIKQKFIDAKNSFQLRNQAFEINMNEYKKIKTGVDGENEVNSAIENTKNASWITTGSVNLPVVGTNDSFENDNIVITNHGIFVLEVKNYTKATLEITQNGEIYYRKGYDIKSLNSLTSENPIYQCNKHVSQLSALLQSLGISNVSNYVHGIIVVPNETTSIENESSFPVLRPAVVCNYISSFPQCFSDKQIIAIADIIKKHAARDKRFSHDIYEIDSYNDQAMKLYDESMRLLLETRALEKEK